MIMLWPAATVREDRDDIFVIPPVPHPSGGIITDV